MAEAMVNFAELSTIKSSYDWRLAAAEKIATALRHKGDFFQGFFEDGFTPLHSGATCVRVRSSPHCVLVSIEAPNRWGSFIEMNNLPRYWAGSGLTAYYIAAWTAYKSWLETRKSCKSLAVL